MEWNSYIHDNCHNQYYKCSFKRREWYRLKNILQPLLCKEIKVFETLFQMELHVNVSLLILVQHWFSDVLYRSSQYRTLQPSYLDHTLFYINISWKVYTYLFKFYTLGFKAKFIRFFCKCYTFFSVKFSLQILHFSVNFISHFSILL